jgi:Bacterial Ig domain
MRLRLLLALALCALAAPASAHAAAEPGINLSLPFSDAQLARVQESGARTARFFMFAHRNDPAQFEGPVAQLAAIGVRPVFVVVGDPANPPTNPAAIDQYASFVRQAAARYAGRVAGWEIWNEQDAPKWWAGMASFDNDANPRDASQYVPLLRAAHAAVKSVDAGAPVVVGGLTGNDYKFVESMYAHGAKGHFDVVATHTDTACADGSPYGYYRDVAGGPISQWAFLGYRSVRQVMEANGDPRPIWITEMGWSSHTGPCGQGRWAGQKPAGVSEADQAKFTTQAFHCLAQDPYVTKALVYKLIEDNNPDPMENRYGILRPDLSPKPVFGALRTYAARGDVLPGSESCGDFAPPSVSVAAPTDGAVFTGALPIRASAEDPPGVARISLYVDDSINEIRNFTNSAAPRELGGGLEWQGAKRLSNGSHRLTVTAVDPMGNVGSRTVTVTKVDPSRLKAIKTRLVVKLRGKGAKRQVLVRIRRQRKGLTNVLGKIKVTFRKKVKGRWKTAHKYGSMAKGYDRKSRRFKVKLKRAQWKVTVAYLGSPGYAKSTRTLRFWVR